MMIKPPATYRLFAILIAFIFALMMIKMMYLSNYFAADLVILVILFLASVLIILEKEWGRRLMRGASMAGMLYFSLKQIFLFNGPDVQSLASMAICSLLIYFYRGPSLQKIYRSPDDMMSSKTVLVVDDDLTFVKLVRSHFIKHGLNVISSESGERGIEMAKRWKPDLIILDVILPGVKGRTVCAKLKEDSRTQDIPVVFVTFKNSLDDISAEMELGAVMHLTKPVDYNHLYEQVIKIIGKG